MENSRPKQTFSQVPADPSEYALVYLGRFVFLLLLVVVWEAAARSEFFPPAFIGQPSVFIPMLWGMIMDGSIFDPIGHTLLATVIAFVIGGVLALLSALVLVILPLLRKIAEPFIDALNALPRVALVPLFIVWFGLGMTSKIVSGVSLMYFILLYNTLAGAQSVDPDHRLLAKSLGLSGRATFMQIMIPTAIPAIFAGLKLGLVYTLLGVVTAELIAGGKGLGSMVSFYSNTFNADGVFAVLVVLVIISYAMSAMMTRLENSLTAWRD